MTRRDRLLWVWATAGAVLFAAVALDVHLDGWLAVEADVAVNNAVNRMQAAGIAAHDIGSVLSLLGANVVTLPAVGAATILCLHWRRLDLAVAAVAMPYAGSLIVDELKAAYGRGYPPGDFHFQTGLGAAAQDAGSIAATGAAFPSGHTLGATLAIGLAVLLAVEAWLGRRRMADAAAWRWRRRALAACAAIALVGGTARVLLQIHWATDVVASWGLSIALGAIALTLVGWGGSAAPLDGASGGRPVRVLGFTGMPGSGKSEAMEVAKARGIPVVRMGDLIWEEVDRQGRPRDAKNVGEVANAMRETHGKDVWSRRTVAKVRQVAAGRPLVIIDGVRSHAEVETFRQELGGDFILVAIHTDRHHRFERMLARGRADDPKEESVLQERDDREIGWGMAQTIALADEMIVNDSGLEQFRANVAALLDRLAR